MKILKTVLIEFNHEAERERLTKHFKGKLRDRLLAIHDAFVSCKWDECHELMKNLNRDELEFVSEVMFDIMKDRSIRNKMKDSPHEYNRDYPKFNVGDFID